MPQQGLLGEGAQFLQEQRGASDFCGPSGQPAFSQNAVVPPLYTADQMSPEEKLNSQLLAAVLQGNTVAQPSQPPLDAYSLEALQTACYGVKNPLQKNSSGSLYKTELCRTWSQTSSCRYGSKCQFAHGVKEQRPIQRHPKYKTELCRTFLKTGMCPYGVRCRFVHQQPHLWGLGIPSTISSPLAINGYSLPSPESPPASLTYPNSPYINSTVDTRLYSGLTQGREIPISPNSEYYVPGRSSSTDFHGSASHAGLNTNALLESVSNLRDPLYRHNTTPNWAGNTSMGLTLDNFNLLGLNDTVLPDMTAHAQTQQAYDLTFNYTHSSLQGPSAAGSARGRSGD